MKSEPKLGELLSEGTDAARDAIHVPIAPVAAGPGEKLKPGQFVKVINPYESTESGFNEVVGCPKKDAIGMVDPFLVGEVTQGEIFWMLVLPGKILKVRHSWTHDEFPEQVTEDEYDDGCRGCYS